jgi:hypothetical protein
MPSTTRKNMWTNEALKITMDVVERGTHLNGKTRSRNMGLGGVLTKVEDSIMITWTLAMQECGLSISLQQFKMEVAELT